MKDSIKGIHCHHCKKYLSNKPFYYYSTKDGKTFCTIKCWAEGSSDDDSLIHLKSVYTYRKE